MLKEVGRIKGLFRYPVKSMAGQSLTTASLGWHGIEGDRRLAFVRRGVAGGFPWLTAVKLPQLLTYQPRSPAANSSEDLPGSVLTPRGEEFGLEGEALRDRLTQAYGAPVEVMRLDHGIFDEAKLSIISESIIGMIAGDAGRHLEVSRFRPNLLVETLDQEAFSEDEWLGSVLQIGEQLDGPAVHVHMRDLRCAMINLDPATAESDPRVLKAVARLNETHAGVYATILSPGRLNIGDRLFLRER